MKTRCLVTFSAICLILLLILPLSIVNCQNYVKYSLQLNADSSALWKITNFSDINASIDTWASFQNKALNLLDSAKEITHRDMTVDANSLQISTTVSAESKTTEYSFLWQNFSIITGNQLIVGDVFKAHNFFGQLYGDAEVQISYPETYTVNSVVPPPYQQDGSAKTLEWPRTQDLVVGKTNIILSNTPANLSNNENNWQQYAIGGSILLAITMLFFGGFLAFKRRKSMVETGTPAETSTVETEEDKIIKILKSSGGSLRQSVIVEQCRFSKAKTSQLLTVLEEKGKITRLKKGRDKIVTLKETAKR